MATQAIPQSDAFDYTTNCAIGTPTLANGMERELGKQLCEAVPDLHVSWFADNGDLRISASELSKDQMRKIERTVQQADITREIEIVWSDPRIWVHIERVE